MSNTMIGWMLVLIAGCLEVLWPIGMKNSQNFTKWGWIVIMALALMTSFGLLTLAVSPKFKLPIGTAYAVWTGMGAAGAVIAGLLLFNEPREFSRLFFLSMVVIGIVGLKITHTEPPAHDAPIEAAAPEPTPVQVQIGDTRSVDNAPVTATPPPRSGDHG